MSTHTVKDSLRRVYTKLGAETRLRAARVAWYAGVDALRQVPESV
ncbi:hypothetical protein [Streptomyces europaeiscabiei]